jgi:hypothetical protein
MNATEITVVDAVMGTGKTSWAIDMMNQSLYEQTFEDASRFLYITPSLSEVQRIQDSCPDLEFWTPQAVNGRKLTHLNELIERNENIASTHELFSRMNRETYEALEGAGYVLVVDEEVEFIKKFDALTERDKQLLFREQMIYVDGKLRVRWNHQLHGDYPENGRFNDIRQLCENGNLIVVNGKFWLWEFPADLIELFDEVVILTYLFEGSYLSTYLKLNDLPYTVRTVVRSPEYTDEHRKYQVVDFDATDEREALKRIKSLVNVVDVGSLNDIGKTSRRTRGRPVNPLSKGWFTRDRKAGGAKTKTLQKATYQFFKRYSGGTASDNLWSCFKSQKNTLKGDGYTKGFLAVNARATNEYKHKASLAYLANIFCYAEIRRYFEHNGMEVDDDQFALSQLVQWVWRSRIREGQPINLYLPSDRMRRLFTEWLDGKYTSDALRLPVWQREADRRVAYLKGQRMHG